MRSRYHFSSEFVSERRGSLTQNGRENVSFFHDSRYIPGPWNLSCRSGYIFLENVFLEGGPQRLKTGTQKKTYCTSIVERVDTQIAGGPPAPRSRSANSVGGPEARRFLIVQSPSAVPSSVGPLLNHSSSRG